METVKEVFTIEEVIAYANRCITRYQLTMFLRQAANREVLIRIFREFEIRYAGLEFCTTRKLAEYLAGELLMLRHQNRLHRKVGLLERIADVIDHRCEDIALSFSGATLAGMMIFMLVL
ncbi:MAG: hypothetical protein IJS39_07350 [Synergistaceae bacterium]|nr:hypothetical protein [Synergistaceae bacterium]